jgi:hypothetical protein
MHRLARKDGGARNVLAVCLALLVSLPTLLTPLTVRLAGRSGCCDTHHSCCCHRKGRSGPAIGSNNCASHRGTFALGIRSGDGVPVAFLKFTPARSVHSRVAVSGLPAPPLLTSHELLQRPPPSLYLA